ncbi:MAG: pyruvate kinase [Gammaproteobacteria bacterium]|nr:pyruvate kinase [Gammaproteobacteria bacterium]MDE0452899.1 pyruvate kinase [Gammaproteobacteria bacterium]
MRRRTKIICTVGPATADYPMLERMYAAGMDIVRLNMSHSDHVEAQKIITWIKTLNRKVKYPVPLLLDTMGPEIRTGELDAPMRLEPGKEVYLTVGPASGEEDGSPSEWPADEIHVNYPELPEAVAVGNSVTLDNGLINLEVLQKSERGLRCRVIDGGHLGSRRHINLPGVHVNLPAIAGKDREDILFGMEHDLDFLALSFVRTADDIAAARELLGSKTLKIIAKIEDREGLANVEEITRAADGVMVARGDLGIEVDIAVMPNIQRNLVRTCARLGKRCVVATHLLESMIENPIPTRAEVTDVANAIYEGVDAIMLSAETSVGRHPVRCVAQLSRIAATSEQFPGLGFAADLIADTDKHHVAKAAAGLAEAIGAAGIVVITRRGVMVDLVTSCQPPTVPIFAFSNNSQTRRRLMLNRGVFSHRTAFSTVPEKTIQTALNVLQEREDIPPDERVVVISDVLAERRVDAIQIRTVGG